MHCIMAMILGIYEIVISVMRYYTHVGENSLSLSWWVNIVGTDYYDVTDYVEVTTCMMGTETTHE